MNPARRAAFGRELAEIGYRMDDLVENVELADALYASVGGADVQFTSVGIPSDAKLAKARTIVCRFLEQFDGDLTVAELLAKFEE